MLTIKAILDRAQAMGYTDTAVAREVGVTKQAVSRWRTGQGLPADIHAAALARVAQLPATAVLTAIVAAKSEGKERETWVRAYGDLARAGLAAVVLAVGLGAPPADAAPSAPDTRHYANSRRRRRQEAATAASRWIARLSGRVNNNQPAPYVIWGIQALARRTLRRLCAWPRGYSALSRESLPVANWPTLGLIAA
jgi:transcriptional regulator with XRE-family HTH domain